MCIPPITTYRKNSHPFTMDSSICHNLSTNFHKELFSFIKTNKCIKEYFASIEHSTKKLHLLLREDICLRHQHNPPTGIKVNNKIEKSLLCTLRGRTIITLRSCLLNPSAVAGSPSVTRLTHSNCTCVCTC